MHKPVVLGLALLLPALGWAAPEAGTTRVDSASDITFVYVPAGCFQMGSSDGDEDEQPQHEVCLAKGFWMGQTEVTQEQYEKVMGEFSSKFTDGENHPVESTSWRRSVAMADKLSQQTGKRFRLPSEAEWEYACTAGGQHSERCGDADIDDMAWYLDNSDESTQPVGEKEPNAWGLMDMNGNVREWLADCWNPSYAGAPADGSAWLSGNCETRVLRGGSWTIEGERLRATNRNRNDIISPSDFIGFRLVQEE